MAAYAVGHKAPDTDSIVAAIALADLKTKTGVETKAAAQGACPPNRSTCWRSSAWPAPSS